MTAGEDRLLCRGDVAVVFGAPTGNRTIVVKEP
jgi:hypothetical protein